LSENANKKLEIIIITVQS